ncbi:MAG: lactonase family protein [Acidobacteriia bacterium]|nr:lactonase family protein [Terriglobia bacterium]
MAGYGWRAGTGTTPARRSVVRALVFMLLTCAGARGAEYLVYAGTYTRGASKGIYAYRFQTTNGKLTPLGVAAESVNPSFLVEQSNHRFLYAVNEDADGAQPGNTVTAFAIDAKTGKLTLLNQVPSRGEWPCHLALDKTGRWLAVANYGSGTMAIMPVRPDGRLGEAAVVEKHEGSSVNSERQQGPHAHQVVFSPDNRFLLLADLGLDKIFVYRFDAIEGSISPADQPFARVAPGAGVRHLAFHPNGKVVYAINELGSTVTAFRYDPAKGALSDFQSVSTLPEGFKGASTTAEVAVNAAGTVLYGSNRGHDSIAIFSIDPERYTLSAMDHAPTMGKTPRHFALDPTGAHLLVGNQDSNDIVVFRVHPTTGQLTPVGRPITDTPMPVCILFVPLL